DSRGGARRRGRVASMAPALFPPEVRAVLARLQNEAPPMPYERVAEVLEEELGGGPDELFAEFSREPMAAASLGQVHRARLRDGRDVVVKVQYPGIDQALRSDIDNLGMVVKTIALAHRALDGRQYFHELAEELAHELDYSREGQLAREFARASAALPDIVVPEIV